MLSPLNSNTDEITELGPVELEGSDVVRTFIELAKPLCQIQLYGCARVHCC
jgi:hypothetical protein